MTTRHDQQGASPYLHASRAKVTPTRDQTRQVWHRIVNNHSRREHILRVPNHDTHKSKAEENHENKYR
jgi:hypothetical protein